MEKAFIDGFKDRFEALSQSHDGKQVLVFAHGGVVNGLTALATRSKRLWIMLPDYCGISRFEYRKGQFVLKTLSKSPILRMGRNYQLRISREGDTPQRRGGRLWGRVG